MNFAQTQEDSSAVSQILTQIQHFASPGECFESREVLFYDQEIANSSEASHFPSQPLRLLSPRGMLISGGSGLPQKTRNSMG